MTARDRARVERIARFLRHLFEPGDLVGIRGLKTSRGTCSGLFDDYRTAAKAALHMESLGGQVYYLLNPVSRALARARSAVVNKGSYNVFRTSKNPDCPVRSAYLIDCDPERAVPGSASEEERECARALALSCVMHLRSLGWPDPTVVDSGNGVQLIYKAERHLHDEPWLQTVLAGLNARCGVAGVRLHHRAHRQPDVLACRGFGCTQSSPLSWA